MAICTIQSGIVEYTVVHKSKKPLSLSLYTVPGYSSTTVPGYCTVYTEYSTVQYPGTVATVLYSSTTGTVLYSRSMWYTDFLKKVLVFWRVNIIS